MRPRTAARFAVTAAVILAVAPLFVIGLIESLSNAYPFFAGEAALLALPLLPFGYFYALSCGNTDC